ncbi:MAG: response regulator [Candidatus Heimdallarchaeota archaeon]|nr:MAG: response regulator [Candidatus Heimdallarchaeota archaeon]
METSNTKNKTQKKPVSRILIIDDERDAVELLELLLTREKHKIEKAYTAQDALEILESGIALPDLILLDIKMPGTDGFTFCHEIKNETRYRHIPVIILSALTFPDDIKRGYECGAIDYILKPWSNHDLIKRIDYHLTMTQT